MHALSVDPRTPGSAGLIDISKPHPGAGSVLVRSLEVGVCGTDAEILAGKHGKAPRDEQRLIIGHECIGVVEEAPSDSAFQAGDIVTPIVRRPDPVPCLSCAAGEWDMCRNGLFTECGIKERQGFCTEYFVCEEEFLVGVDAELAHAGVLLEPLSVVAKAWEQIERIGLRAYWAPQRVLVTGAGPVGLLAALLGRQRGLEVHVLDRDTAGRKPALARALGAEFHGTSNASQVLTDVVPDIVLECTGASEVVIDVVTCNARNAVTCLVGVSAAGRRIPVGVGLLNRSIVLENDVVFGTVNANHRHYALAKEALASADPAWLAALITRRVPIEKWPEALKKQPDDVKVVILPSKAA
jgi:threonine dehydrogenase-like Zn-dependent dehydrogenase